VKAVPPTVLFDDSLRLDLGPGRRVELRNRGRANSPNDVTVYLPEQRILFTGDILVSPLPYVGGSNPGPWIQVLRELEAIPVQAIVPGHGAVQADHGYTRTVREVFEATRARIEALYRDGKRLPEAREQVDISDLRGRFRNRRGELFSPEDWKDWSTELVARMVQCVHGYEC
jgi:glyoxylase-like metal-dependent hydrolase (beta-lactamase superfamily II)